VPPQESSSQPALPPDFLAFLEFSQLGAIDHLTHPEAPAPEPRLQEHALTSPPVAPGQRKFSDDYWGYIWGTLNMIEPSPPEPLLGYSSEIQQERDGFICISGQALDSTIEVARRFGLSMKPEVIKDDKCVIATRTFNALHFAISLEQNAVSDEQTTWEALPSLSFEA
jgi:hypothetical protein